MHVVIINGSPRIRSNSNTDKIIASFVKGLSESKSTYELYSISDRKEWDGAREAFLNNDQILIALPLYVECIPGLLLEFLETLPVKETQGTQLSFLLQSGFAEGCQLRCGEEFLKSLPALLGCTYGGCLVKGDNFGIRIMEGKRREQMVGPYENMGRVFAREGNFLNEASKEFTGPEVFPKPIQFLISIMFRTVAKQMFKNAAKKWGCKESLLAKPYVE